MAESTRSGQAPIGLTRAEQNQEWGAAPPPDHEKRVDPNTPKCRGCGRYHGSVNQQLACLRFTIGKRDQEISLLRAEIESLQRRLRLERAGPEPTKTEIPSETKS